MRRFWPLLVFVAMLIMIRFVPEQQSKDLANSAVTDYQRLISLSPSITETLYALGLADRLVAVTDFCDYPPEAQSLPTVGGYTDPSLEAIVTNEPDLVILLQSQQQLRQQLNNLGIATHSIDNSTLTGIEASIVSIAQLTGQQQQANAILDSIHKTIEQVQDTVSEQPPVKTLISIAHYVNSEKLDIVYIAGQRDFYNDLLQLAGGINAYSGNSIKVPSVSEEGIIRMNPDVIIDIFPEADDHHSDMKLVRQQWLKLEAVSAVQHQRVHIIERDYASIPGPRIFQLLPEIARLLHPELDWSELND
jgi:iron complex transport system substrate-binding protein